MNELRHIAMNQYFIDTNIFLRIVDTENETMRRECEELLLLSNLSTVKIYTSLIIFSEINWVLSTVYKFNKDEIILFLKSLLSLKNLEFIENGNIYKTLNIFKGNNIKFVDAVVASCIEIQNGKMAIISYDKDFDKLGVVRKEPRQVIKDINGKISKFQAPSSK